MKTIQSLALLASIAAAAPAAEPQVGMALGYEYNELIRGSCKDVTFIWTRGTTELSNMGEYVGGRMVPYLKRVFPSLAIQGVDYGAGVTGNLLPGGGDYSGIKEATRMYTMAHTKCPDTVITGGGYSQGAAITHRSVEKLPEEVKAKIAGITLYGDTQYLQDGGKIKNFPADRVHVYCNGYAEWRSYSADGVCNGLLVVNYGHMSYGDALKPGAEFLKERVSAWQSSNSGSKSSGSSSKPKPKSKPKPPPEPEADETVEEPAPKKKPAPKKSSGSSSSSSTSKSSGSSTSKSSGTTKKTTKPKPKETDESMEGMDMRVVDDGKMQDHMRTLAVEAEADADTYTAGYVPTML